MQRDMEMAMQHRPIGLGWIGYIFWGVFFFTRRNHVGKNM